jgi:hypothetical protein
MTRAVIRIGGATFWLAALLVGAAATEPVQAQMSRARISRPSETTGSAVFGRTGGRYTVQTNVEGLRSRQFGTANNTGVGGFSPHGTRAPSDTSSRQSLALGAGLSATGSLGYLGARNHLGAFRPGLSGDARVRNITGQTFATDLRVSPAQAARINMLRGLQTPMMSIDEPGSTFHRVFGLVEAPPEAETTAAPTALAPLIAAQSEVAVGTLADDALMAFRVSTSGAMEQRTGEFARAGHLLAGARDMQADEVVPALLGVHAALARDQVSLAVFNLHEATRRAPDLTAALAGLASHFGDYDAARRDSANLDAQMRRWVQLGDDNPGSVEAQLVSAYCATVLGDRARAQRTLERAETLVADVPPTVRERQLVSTVAAVLNGAGR